MGTRSDSNQPFSLYCVSPIGYSSKRTAFTGLVAVTAGHPGDSEAPPQANMVRVSGSGVTREVFAAAGLTTAAKLNGVGEAFAGRPLSAFKTILDWGAGSGRVARPLATYFAPDAELWCVDVDSVNVEWGRKTNFVPNGRWQTIPFYPPTNLPAEHFDFIYGISVFTHLTEAAQEVWLKELSRISHSGALLVMSANTEFCATRFAERGTGHLRDLLIYGIADRLIDGNLGPHLSRGNYYRSTYHLTEYVRAVWGQYFEVLDLIHAADSHVQDFVVLRKR
jgi:hypothetical protein